MAKSLLDKRLSNNSEKSKTEGKKKTATNKDKEKNKPDKERKIKTIKDTGLGKKTKTEDKNIYEAHMSIDDILDKELDQSEKKKITKYKTDSKISVVKKAAVITGCIYICFLIYGVLVTDYTYDEAGNAVPMKMSYTELKLLDDFEKIADQYYAMQELYGKMLDIDYQYYLNQDDAIALSARYEGLLDDVSKVSMNTSAISVSTAYSHIQEMLLSWIKDDIAVYLQNMSAAISQNSKDRADKAAQDRMRLQSNYEIITNNLVALGKQVKGMDINNLIEWTPEKHNEKLTGKDNINYE